MWKSALGGSCRLNVSILHYIPHSASHLLGAHFGCLHQTCNDNNKKHSFQFYSIWIAELLPCVTRQSRTKSKELLLLAVATVGFELIKKEKHMHQAEVIGISPPLCDPLSFNLFRPCSHLGKSLLSTCRYRTCTKSDMCLWHAGRQKMWGHTTGGEFDWENCCLSSWCSALHGIGI